MADRLAAAVEMINQKLKAGSRIDRRHFFQLCLIYSKFIDVTLAANQSPASSKDMLLLLKQILSQKDDSEVRPAVIALLLSFKAAYRAGWFTVDESAEVLTLANSMLEAYHPVPSASPSDCAIVQSVVGEVLSRYYPWLGLDKVLLCLELEVGHKALLSDFNVVDSLDSVRLFTVNKSQLDSPACLSVPAASFMLNGYGVEKRTANTGDLGCQPPGDCGRLIKKGPNILQIVGEFQAPYTVVIATTYKLSPKIAPSNLNEAAHSIFFHSDDDLIEGPSLVSLLCPLSRDRIVNPVRGASCNHLQCFDYNNYMEVNFRRPSWRCPYCNRVVTCVDLRFDKKTAEILAKVDTGVRDVTLASDGSWEVSSHREAPNAEVIELSETENQNASDFRQHERHSSPAFAAAAADFFEPDTKPGIREREAPSLPDSERLASLPRFQAGRHFI